MTEILVLRTMVPAILPHLPNENRDVRLGKRIGILGRIGYEAVFSQSSRLAPAVLSVWIGCLAFKTYWLQILLCVSRPISRSVHMGLFAIWRQNFGENNL